MKNFIQKLLSKFKSTVNQILKVDYPALWKKQDKASKQRIILAGLVLVFAFYQVVMLRSMYESSCVISVKSNTKSHASTDMLSALSLTGVSSSHNYVLMDAYLHSPHGWSELNKKTDIRAHYKAYSRDWILGVSPFSNDETLIKFYKDRVNLTELGQGVFTVSLESYLPEVSKATLTQIVKNLEELIDFVEKEVLEEQLANIKEQIDLVTQASIKTKNSLLAFQQEHALIDPIEQIKLLIATVGSIEQDKIKLEANLKEMLGYLKEDAPDIRLLKNKINALTLQMDEERQKVIGLESLDLNILNNEHYEIRKDLEFLEKELMGLYKISEQIRIQNSQRQHIVITVSEPTLPIESSSPNRFRNTVHFTILLGLAYLSFRIIAGVIRENQ